MDDVQIAHLAGVFDAAGNLTVHIAPRDGYELGYEYRPLVRLNRNKKDSALIGKFDHYAQEQGIHPSIEEKENHLEYEVYGPENIRAFLEPLLPHLVSKYELTLLMVDEILPAVEENEHLTKQGFYDLMGPADVIRKETTHGPDPKYTQEYFADEFGDEVNT